MLLIQSPSLSGDTDDGSDNPQAISKASPWIPSGLSPWAIPLVSNPGLSPCAIPLGYPSLSKGIRSIKGIVLVDFSGVKECSIDKISGPYLIRANLFVYKPFGVIVWATYSNCWKLKCC